ncbi:MAG: M14 metallopeptidase family protein, partial [Fimbriimonadaceae bacterium]
MRRLFAVFAFISVIGGAFSQVPSPKEFFGHDVCEDYWLANYKQYTAYMQELDKKSDRLSLESIGKTEFGNDQLMAIVTDPGNRRNLQHYRKASERLARGRGFKDDADALNFAKKQKAVIWIDGGLHASESLVAQQLIETAYRLTSSNDPTVKRFLKDCIILLVHANPDGMDLVADWYMRKPVPKERSLAGLPVLYQKYIGHDNNRDFYANNMAETKNMNRILYSVWYPQIVYNHHQSAPAGTIMFCPPFRNPFNYNMDPMTEIGTELLGTFMHQRMISEGKRGTAMRGSTLYSTWWNGGLRTTTYFHNMIGILTETYGSPNPGPLPFVPRFQIPSTDVPFPVEAGRMWHLRDSLEYEISANYAILDYASRNREKLLFDFYRAAKNQ